MADEISGRGDPVRTLELLWGVAGKAPRRGPKPRLLLADIVRKAIEIADAEGIDAVSTRRLAESFGISPMSFYTYIPGKAELLDLMMDAVSGDGLEPRPVFDPKRWRDNLSLIARGYRDFYLNHPWVFELATHRPVLGPNTMLAWETALSAADGLGLDEIEMDMVITLISNFVHGAVRDAAREKMVKETTGMTDTEWWERVAPFLETVDFSPYPVSSRVGPVVGAAYGAHDPQRAFEFGLERLLDGLALFIEARQDRKPVSA